MRSLLLLCCCISAAVYGQKSVAEKAFNISAIAAKYHVSPRAVNDSFAVQVFRSFMDQIDPYTIYFTQQEYQQLQTAAVGIDEDITRQSTVFLQTISKQYFLVRKKAVQQMQSLLSKPFSFSAKTYFTTNSEADAGKYIDEPQPQRMKAYLQWRVLTALSDLLPEDSTHLSPAFVQQHIGEAQRSVQSSIEKRYAQLAADSVKMARWLEETYLNAIATAYDPHTEYFSNEAYDEFEAGLSSESMAFGFGLEPNSEGNLLITSVMPGSAAWKSSNIHEGDMIIAMKPEGEKTVSVANATPEELNALFERYADKTVEFTIKAADGTTRVVKLKKQAIRNEENVVRGWILDGQPRLGFISLPSFYTQTNDGIGTSCAEDVAREIVKLKQEKIDGLVLDLRFNGGGSIEEAAAMLGIFIDIGPLGVVKVYSGGTEPIKDVNRGTIYDGPLVVMVNGASASASEMLAATLQDYRKAVIVGSTTFGKATMQVVVPLVANFDFEKYAPDSKQSDATKDFLKITMGKLYRVNGKTAQNTGVVPDVYLPDYFEAAQFTERSYGTALPADSISVQLPYRALSEKYSRQTFKAFEQSSVANDPELVQLKNTVRLQQLTNALNRVPLMLSEYNLWQNDEWGDTLETTAAKKGNAQSPYAVANTRLDAAYNAMDSYQKENDDMIMNELMEDAWLRQVYLLFKNVLIKTNQ